MSELAPVRADPVLTRDELTMKIHLRYQISERLVEDVRCRIGGEWVEISLDDTIDYDEDRFCGFCFARRTLL